MCFACEEADMAYRWQLVEQIAKGEMPPGLTARGSRRYGLAAAGRDRDHAGGGWHGDLPAEGAIGRPEPKGAAGFVCDTPDSE